MDSSDAGPAAAARKHPVRAVVTTVLAGLMLFLALAGPGDVEHRTLWVFLRIPVEAIVAAAVLLVLPARVRRWAAAFAGLVIGLLAVEKVLDIGFYLVLDRPFDLVLDWNLFGAGLSVVTASAGRAAAIGGVIGLLLVIAGGLVLTTLSAVRLTRVAAAHRPVAIRVLAVLTVLWIGGAAFDVQVVGGVPVADRSTAALVSDRAAQVRAGLRDKKEFAAEAAVDPFRGTAGSDLLTGLRGKDVILAYVESYGRSAIEDPQYAKQVNAVLDAGTRQLAAAGIGSRSGWLTSSTSGGRSWLAHATLQSGLWVNNQQRYRTLVSSDRLTLTRTFQRGGWRTVSVEPANKQAWPESDFYGYDFDYDFRNLGYRGPKFSYATMPDQYTLEKIQRSERAPGHKPVMVSYAMLSSHAPWAPLPRQIDWKDLGDGSIFNSTPMAGDSPNDIWGSRTRLRNAYRQSLEYTLGTLVSYAQRYADDDLVLVFLGDHQPASYITGAGASRDVPITIVARDRAVLDRVSGWGWQNGLRPGKQAPVWRMDTFRNRFLTAFAQ